MVSYRLASVWSRLITGPGYWILDTGLTQLLRLVSVCNEEITFSHFRVVNVNSALVPWYGESLKDTNVHCYTQKDF